MTDRARTAPRVLLVFPRFDANSFWCFKEPAELHGAKYSAPPLGLITLAALLPTAWQLRLVDCNTGELTEDDVRGADLVMTGGMLPQWPSTTAVIALCNRLGVPVCVGGPAPTSTPEAYAAADFRVLGEAEGIIHEFVAAWERGDRAGEFRAEKFKADVTRSPIPRFDLLNFRDYIYIGVQFSRGCPFTCEFCDIIELYGRSPRTKTVSQMLGELDRLHALGYRGHVDFVDDNLIGNKKAVKLFLPHLIEWQKARGYPFRFSTEASLNLADDAELLGLMRQANFFVVFIGIETPDETTLIHTSKKQNTRRSISESVHRIYAAGMFVTAGFIVGFDTETDAIGDAMIGCVTDTAIPAAMIGLLTALPSTQLHRRLAREGRLHSNEDWDREMPGDQCTAGLNFATKRPRRQILADYRRILGVVYEPRAFFDRATRVGLALDRPRLREETVNWRRIAHDLRTFVRLSWRMSVGHRELAGPFWRMVLTLALRNPRAFEFAMVNVVMFTHLYPFSRFVIATLERQIAAIDDGSYVEQVPLPANTDAACARPAALPAVA
ncbi:B12-binding domain-containing radical SAM protein [Methylobacterium sp. NEAU 140]|uniref:B12-binding domain-containing radical SAM protein n=1 Tax=Methylobacterium sp. NEAU 140 TaxID=3064945 RepID=UPI002736753C|nr:B12-binding domain-containing radical SAM protein [Methylobacterium sp. NEAU 140]MDP4024410.1 B12-binding domain-containing radical SAM protein [Methylobacterium sp. NEAU 140]